VPGCRLQTCLACACLGGLEPARRLARAVPKPGGDRELARISRDDPVIAPFEPEPEQDQDQDQDHQDLLVPLFTTGPRHAQCHLTIDGIVASAKTDQTSQAFRAGTGVVFLPLFCHL
jgi:hypothetical protein